MSGPPVAPRPEVKPEEVIYVNVDQGETRVKVEALETYIKEKKAEQGIHLYIFIVWLKLNFATVWSLLMLVFINFIANSPSTGIAFAFGISFFFQLVASPALFLQTYA